MSDVVKVKGKLFWVQHNVVNELSGKYQLILGCLSDAAAKALEDLKLEVSEKDDKPEQGKFITCKSSNPIKITDLLGVDLADKKIGNGSECKAIIRPYEWTFKNKKGVSPSLNACVVTNLIELGNAAEELADAEDVL
jgi:hypothetical protein